MEQLNVVLKAVFDGTFAGLEPPLHRVPQHAIDVLALQPLQLIRSL